MRAIGAACLVGFYPTFHRHNKFSGKLIKLPKVSPSSLIVSAITISTRDQRFSKSLENKKFDEKSQQLEEDGRLRLKDYFEHSQHLVTGSDSGPPRWFSPLECGLVSRLKDSPILLYLPGIDGVGLGLKLQHQTLAKIFDIWCLHIPITDRTSFTELVRLVETTVRLENAQSAGPKRPIYLVGESFGGCIALSVAARNPNIDLVLILANPATSIQKSAFPPETFLPLSTMMPEQLRSGLPYILTLLAGAPLKMVAATLGKGLPLEHAIGELSEDSIAMSSYLSVLSDGLSEDSLSWKLKMLKSGAAYANSRLHAVKAQTLILTSGQDRLLPSIEEGERLHQLLSNSEIRTFDDCGHALFLEEDISLVSILKATSFYRRRRSHDYVLDYFPPTPSEFEQIYGPHRWLEVATDPVMLSTLESGKIVRNLDGIPSQGPVLFVGYHMMLGFELIPMVSRFWMERNILLRGIGHPMMFKKLRKGRLPSLSSYDTFRSMGAVPVSAANFYKLFSTNSHALLYPGGMREALHRKGEEYKLFWPEQAEFVRMASRFGAKIIPFGCVGEDDVSQLLMDYHDLRQIPYFKAAIEELTNEAVKLRTEALGEVTNQDVHLPIMVPKIPGRFYYLFGKPIETLGRKQELKSRDNAHEVYLEVKQEVEKCLDYLKDKREKDPYRNIFTRLSYQATHGFDSEVPTFEI